MAKTILKSQAVISKRARARAAGGMCSMPSGKEQGGWRPGKPWDKADGRRLMRPVGFVQAQHTGSCCCGAARGVLGRSEGGGIGSRLETQDKRGGFDRLRVQKAYQRGEKKNIATLPGGASVRATPAHARRSDSGKVCGGREVEAPRGGRM